jgi:hypothetical protein
MTLSHLQFFHTVLAPPLHYFPLAHNTSQEACGMEKKFRYRNTLAFLTATTTVLWFGAPRPTNAQQASTQANAQASQSARTGDTTVWDLASFFDFLNTHREIREQVQKQPNLVKNRAFVESHPALQSYLQTHPGVREEIREDPGEFMEQEQHYAHLAYNKQAGNLNPNQVVDTDDRRSDADRSDADRRDPGRRDLDQPGDSRDRADSRDRSGNPPPDSDRRVADERRQDPDAGSRQDARSDNRQNGQDSPRRELANFDRFLDNHREISEQLRKNPTLAENPEYLRDHPALQTYLQDHPEVRHQIELHPNAFMHQEERYDTREEARNFDRRDFDERNTARDTDPNRRQLASFDRFLDEHRETAEQLRRDPSLVNNQQFVQRHPALQAYLQEHQGVREQLAQNPNTFMRDEHWYDRHEGLDRGQAMQAAGFREFLSGHTNISHDLAVNPAKANDPDYQRSHPEFKAYLSAHPEVQTALNHDPQNFMKTVQPPPTTTTGATASAAKPAPTTTETKPPKQQ